MRADVSLAQVELDELRHRTRDRACAHARFGPDSHERIAVHACPRIALELRDAFRCLAARAH